MSVEFAACLQRYAEVIVRVGLNLQSGQRLLLAEPFELQGVSREAADLVAAVERVARAAGAEDVAVIWGDPTRWREAAAGGGDAAFLRLLADNAARMHTHVRNGGALLFLPSGHPDLMRGIPARQVARLRAAAWRAYGKVAPDLIAGRTNWTTAPAPTATWADTVFPDVGAGERLARLWQVVFSACRADVSDPLAAWAAHLDGLRQRRDRLNEQRVTTLRWQGEGTDLTVAPASGHVWCTACLHTTAGRPFVANLPTEEVFTAPDPASANGVVRIARPVAYGGGIIEGATLEFRDGRVVRAHASVGDDLLRCLLDTDPGASRLGEIALVAEPSLALTCDGICFHQTLLDENAQDHIALGEAYPFTVRGGRARSLNHSLIHVDLPVAARGQITVS